MLIHNKRLHPRRPCEPNEHYHGCFLHEMEEQRTASSSRNSSSPSQCTTPSCRYNSLSSLSSSTQRQRPRSQLNLSRTTTPSTYDAKLSASNKRNSIGAYPNASDLFSAYYDTVDSKAPAKQTNSRNFDSKSIDKTKAKSTICLNSSLVSASATGKSDKRHNHTVTFKCHDSPDEIIANLFPGIDEIDTPYLRKGHGAAQLAKNRTTQKDWSNTPRSTSAMGNYAASSDNNRKNRTYSTSSDNSVNNKERYRPVSSIGSRHYTVERDFDRLRLERMIRFFHFERNKT